jgi:hypothetical protein
MSSDFLKLLIIGEINMAASNEHITSLVSREDITTSQQTLSGLINHEMNIDSYPAKLNLDDSVTELAFGDMHGNALKMIALLKATGVIDIPEDKYSDFVSLYRETYQLMENHSYKGRTKDPETRFRAWKHFTESYSVFTPKMNDRFNSILSSIKVINNQRFVTFLGDILSDRGASDLFTLKLLNHLKKEGMQYRIIFSNHDLEFVWQFERLMQHDEHPIDDQIMYRYGSSVDRHQGASVHHLLASIRQGAITKEEVRELVMEAYYPHLKLFDYTLPQSKDGIALFTHAPLSLEKMNFLINNQFGFFLDTHNRESMIKSIDRVNMKFSKIVLNGRFSHSVPKDDELRRCNPLYLSLWARDISVDMAPPTRSSSQPKLLRETDHETLKPITFIHGHNTDKRGPAPREGILCLDDLLGKELPLHKGRVNIAALSDTVRPEISDKITATSVKRPQSTFFSLPEQSLQFIERKSCVEKAPQFLADF